MKKIVSLMLTMVMLVTTLCSCGVPEAHASGIFDEMMKWEDFHIELKATSNVDKSAFEKSGLIYDYNLSEDVLDALSRGNANIDVDWLNSEGCLVINGDITLGDREKIGTADKKTPEFYVELKDVYITSYGLSVSVETLQSLYDFMSRTHEKSIYYADKEDLIALEYILETTKKDNSTHAVIFFGYNEADTFKAYKDVAFAVADVVVNFIEDVYKDYKSGYITADKNSVTLNYETESLVKECVKFMEYNREHFDKDVRGKRGTLCDNLEARLRPIFEKYTNVFLYTQDCEGTCIEPHWEGGDIPCDETYVEPHWKGQEIPCNDISTSVYSDEYINCPLDDSAKLNCTGIECPNTSKLCDTDECAVLVRDVEERLADAMDEMRWTVDSFFEGMYATDFAKPIETLKSEDCKQLVKSFKGSYLKAKFTNNNANEINITLDCVLNHEDIKLAQIKVDKFTITNKASSGEIKNTYTEFNIYSKEFDNAVREYRGHDVGSETIAVTLNWKRNNDGEEYAQSGYTLDKGGERIGKESVRIYTINYNAYVPLRRICEDLGFEVLWNDTEKKTQVIRSHPDPNVDAITLIDMPGVVIDGTTYVDVENFKRLGLIVDYLPKADESGDWDYCRLSIIKTSLIETD